MKRNIVWTMALFAGLLLSMPAAAGEKKHKDDCTCSIFDVAGTWGYSETGTMYLPAPYGATPYASVGSYTIELDGSVSGARTASLGGTILKATIKGVATVDSDCTGTVTLSFFDPSGNPAGTAVKAIVYVDNAKEARMIITTAPYPSVLVTEAKKLFPDGEKRHFPGY
jgi:hypothetical protein